MSVTITPYVDINSITKSISELVVIGMIVPFSGAAISEAWKFCDGSTLPIADYPELYEVIGSTFGEATETEFYLPDLRGRVPVGVSDVHTMAETGGEDTHILSVDEIPPHTHIVPCGRNHGGATYCYDDGGGMMAHQTTTVSIATGGGLAHNNMQPYLTLNYIIKVK